MSSGTQTVKGFATVGVNESGRKHPSSFFLTDEDAQHYITGLAEEGFHMVKKTGSYASVPVFKIAPAVAQKISRSDRIKTSFSEVFSSPKEKFSGILVCLSFGLLGLLSSGSSHALVIAIAFAVVMSAGAVIISFVTGKKYSDPKVLESA